MPLPPFNSFGDLPVGIHRATLDEVIIRFGAGTAQRQNVTTRLSRIYNIVQATGELERFIVFGSYITAKSDPNDVDIVLVMRDNFRVTACDEETRRLFDHQQADKELGASIFWTRPALLIFETLDEFIAYWQIKRDKTHRGIVEVVP